MAQIANCQYVCDAINAYAGRSYVPTSGTALRCANVEYLMKMIDKTTRDITGGGTTASNYQATYTSTQVVDTTGVSQVLPLIKWKVTAPGSITNGSITASATYVRYGGSVTVTISPSSGYELDTISATGVTLSGSGSTRTFMMPKSNVTITGSFKAIFQTQTWTTPGSYSCDLPVGTFKMTAVSGKGGTGGAASDAAAGSSGQNGNKASQTFTISTTETVTVIIGSNGSNGTAGTVNSSDVGTAGTGGSGGSYGNGNNGGNGTVYVSPGGGARSMLPPPDYASGGGGGGGGASGINGRYYVIGGNGGSGGTSSTSNAPGGGGGGGGTLTGTAVTGTATTDGSSVKIELA